MHMTNGADLAMIFFIACNTIRCFAYFPQLVRVMRDRDGAAAVSCCTWLMFTLANASTAIYAGLVLRDRGMTAIFLVSTLCSFAIVAATLLRRRLHQASAPRRPMREQGSAG
jgi:predicted MFS family arabinose efflux permease